MDMIGKTTIIRAVIATAKGILTARCIILAIAMAKMI